jgi:hypothetical protein
MGKRIWPAGLLVLALTGSPMAWGNTFFSRAPQFNLPDGAIAFMGCYWSPQSIVGTGGDTSAPPTSLNSNTNLYNSGNVKVGVDTNQLGQMIIGDQAPPTSTEATDETNQAVLEKGAGIGLALTPVNYSTVYQNALLMHVLNPAKWGYNPQLTQYCGMKPYILIGIIDYCDAYPCSAKIREKENDKPISYWGRRSILEQDADVFANKGAQHAVALEFFLVSTANGSTLWQGNLMTTGGKGASYQGLTEGLVENALKNLMRK